MFGETDPSPLRMDLPTLQDFLAREFPQFEGEVLSLNETCCCLGLQIEDKHLRPGRTVSGPTLMALADVALYAAILARLGPIALAVTTDFTCHFLNKPSADRPLLAEASLLKLGKRLVIGEVRLFSEGEQACLAHVVATYSIPPQLTNTRV